jgi:hypothetical protein
MLVKDVIEKLSKLDPNLVVHVYSAKNNFGDQAVVQEVKEVYSFIPEDKKYSDGKYVIIRGGF